MNVVEMIKKQLSGSDISSLSSLIGESEEKTQSAVATAVPAILSGLSTMASSGNGAQKVASALSRFDPKTDLSGMLSGQAGSLLEQGSGILNSIFGDKSLAGIVSALSRVSGVGEGAMKTLVKYLAPLVMGTITQRVFAGKPVTGQGLMSFFSEQRSQIADALPRGFSLNDVPGLADARETARRASDAIPAGDFTAIKWLAPALIALGVLAVLWFTFWRKGETTTASKTPNATNQSPVVSDRSYLDAKAAEAAKSRLEDATRLGKDLTDVYGSVSESLSGIKDAASAEAALPALQELNGRLDTMNTMRQKLPESARSSIESITTDKLDGLKAIIQKVLDIPGVREKLKPILDEILTKLGALGGTPQ
jgi:predicted lipid-binding transport protein (Tim44 family)